VPDLDYDPAAHYDHVTAAWQMLLGDELHYGVFTTGEEPLATATAELTNRMIDAAQLWAGLDVLDVGCGSGAPACRLARDSGVRVLGITTSTVGVAEATARAAAEGLDGAQFELRDGTDNQLPDASFDRVWVLESSHLMRERQRLLAECARVLRPGGRLVLCDLIRHREIPFGEVRDRRADFVTLRTAFGEAHFESLDFYATGLAHHGLRVDRIDDLTEATLPTFDRWRANAEEHRAAVVAAIGADGHEAFVRSCDILEGLWRDGTFGYGLLAARKPTL
jgi:27-O-demethylrifamycin SV methyltransferase